MKKIIASLPIVCLLLLGNFVVPNVSFAQPDTVTKNNTVDTKTAPAPTGQKTGLQINLTNPLKADNLEGFVSIILSTLLKFLIPILAILFIYTGFEMVMSRGNKDEWKKAKIKFFNLVIGAVLILGAWTFGNVIMNTLKAANIID